MAVPEPDDTVDAVDVVDDPDDVDEDVVAAVVLDDDVPVDVVPVEVVDVVAVVPGVPVVPEVLTTAVLVSATVSVDDAAERP